RQPAIPFPITINFSAILALLVLPCRRRGLGFRLVAALSAGFVPRKISFVILLFLFTFFRFPT
ncbi:MAG TPA: hypothetical protein PK405_02005, partial [Hyphomicrobiales bacterium]|nr:hypothetical protein [Hyphomicrobiales bacterium]